MKFTLLFVISLPLYPFCGFYVGKAGKSIYNKSSQVAIVHQDDKSVITMSNDYQGKLKEFAMVIPVPEVLQKEQIHVGDKTTAILDHLDAYSAPRLVEYFDTDPCLKRKWDVRKIMRSAPRTANDVAFNKEASEVKIEASYTVGEYDILILSAKESNGLVRWLKRNGYKLPKGAEKTVGSYLKQDMKFFVAKVNLKEQAKTGFTKLRPLQIAYSSPKYMLPIRLGTLNAQGAQELLIYHLTSKGRVETTNYRTVKLPTDMDIPLYVKDEFPKFYKAMFTEQTRKENNSVVFLEYAWDMGWCDPCAADPLSQDELKELGVFWLNSVKPDPRVRSRRMSPANVFITRMHVSYTEDKFPEDLFFQETTDRQNFQGRFVLRHAWKGEASQCSAAKSYFIELENRKEKRAQSLASLTGWNINSIRKRMDFKGSAPSQNAWWQGLWK